MKNTNENLIEIYETGLKTFNRANASLKSKKEAYAKILEAANVGLLEAQLKIGEIFDFGNGEGSWDDAAKYYKMASEQGSAEANYNLAIIYYRTGWDEKVSEETNEDGFTTVTTKFVTEGDVEVHLRRAAESNYAPAQFLLGKELLNGNNVIDANKDEAKKWLELSAKNGIEEATELLKENY